MALVMSEVPYLGSFSRARRAICRQLRLRPAVVAALWGNDPKILQVAWGVSQIVAEKIGWPNDRFIPEDPCEIVFAGYPSGLEVAEALAEIDITFPCMCDYLPVGQYGDFISRTAAFQPSFESRAGRSSQLH